MVESVKTVLLGAVRQMLRPLVRLLLRNGVSFAEYAETAKTVFVEVARRDFRTASDTNSPTSHAALLCGLSEAEIEAVSRAIAESPPASNANLDRIGRVLAGWHQDPDFTGPYGLPLELSLAGDGYTFSELVNRYCGDVSASGMRDELVRVGAVTILPGDRLRVLTRSYIPGETDPAGLQFMGAALRDLAETLDYNLNPSVEGGYFERRVWTPAGIDQAEMPHFDALVNQRGQEFLETLDNWLTAKETEAEQVPETERIRVGVGIYMFSNAERSFRES
jgi:hypothetical protein